MPADTLKKLFKRVQEGVDGVADALLGDKAERLLDREIREVDDALHAARSEHAAVKAQRIAAEERQLAARGELGEAEAKVEVLLRRRRGKQARAAAEAVVRLQQHSNAMAEELRELQQRETQFALVVEQLEHKLRRIKHQFDTLRASVSLQRAQAVVARRQPGPAPHPEPAVASAERMRRRDKQAAKSAGSRTPTTRPDAATPQAQAVDAVVARIGKRIKSPPAGKH